MPYRNHYHQFTRPTKEASPEIIKERRQESLRHLRNSSIGLAVSVVSMPVTGVFGVVGAAASTLNIVSSAAGAIKPDTRVPA